MRSVLLSCRSRVGALVLAVLTACSQASPREPAATTPPVPVSLDMTPSQAFLGEPVPATCQGARIDLAQLGACICKRLSETFDAGVRVSIRASMWCGPEYDAAELPTAIEVTLTPEARVVASGAEVEVTLRVVNRSAVAVPLRFDEAALGRRLDVVDREGNDVTKTGDCDRTLSSARNDHLIVLLPNGVAERRFRWFASSVHGALAPESSSCNFERRGYPPGAYELRLHVPLQGRPVARAILEVR